MKVSFFRNKWEGRSATCASETADQELRGFLLYFFGLTLFSDCSGSRISSMWLQYLADLDEVDNYAWGAAMLAHLYSQLYRASNGTKTVGGFWPFVQVFVYYILSNCRLISLKVVVLLIILFLLGLGVGTYYPIASTLWPCDLWFSKDRSLG